MTKSLLGVKQICVPSTGSLSKGVFERRTSTGSKAFSFLICLDDIKFVLLSFFTLIEAIWLKIWAKPSSKNEKGSLPVHLCRLKTSLLKFAIISKVTNKKMNFQRTVRLTSSKNAIRLNVLQFCSSLDPFVISPGTIYMFRSFCDSSKCLNFDKFWKQLLWRGLKFLVRDDLRITAIEFFEFACDRGIGHARVFFHWPTRDKCLIRPFKTFPQCNSTQNRSNLRCNHTMTNEVMSWLMLPSLRYLSVWSKGFPLPPNPQ